DEPHPSRPPATPTEAVGVRRTQQPSPAGRVSDGELAVEMDCESAVLRVYEYLDGELTVWRRRAIARHLDDCPPCAHGLTFEMERRQVMVSKCHEEVPAERRDRIARTLGLDL